ncbi:electron transfer flavoprotein subunit alpha/FixB family protein [Paraliomyxa miuraensis]|uniref:electron transfer flavoprotein subunit alpha/FixB family protein n=1 Tax=Paraliomyxa miuraensis TaxID=376150 RepID=UPI00225B3E74|nr:electron transfer flavoprotein subunit alpha/FixB family protein [Paraliomyxa miuraensis]MCX4243262.1 electron transfer flavoprotein subunit alpha/FixB family protein [Paraliomyxa miuraensis]
MSNVLVIVESDGSGPKAAALPGITAGQQLAAATGGQLHLLVLGASPDAAAQALASGGYGASAVHAIAGAELEPFTAEAWTDAVVAAVRELGVTAFGGTASSTLREVVPRAAAVLDAPIVTEITGVTGADAFTREISAGRAIATLKVSHAPFGFTARASDFAPAEPGSPATTVSALSAGSVSRRGATVVGVEKTQSARPALTEADVVVSGGRGMREGANFKVLEELTDLLGGALGASRAATDAGMVPADLQVGQTGKVVAPNLYFAVAISGAIQHLAGMKGSKTIVAINKDPEAPIFQVADYGLVAKWEDAVPQLVELVRAHKGG